MQLSLSVLVIRRVTRQAQRTPTPNVEQYKMAQEHCEKRHMQKVRGMSPAFGPAGAVGGKEKSTTLALALKTLH